MINTAPRGVEINFCMLKNAVYREGRKDGIEGHEIFIPT